MRIHNWWIYLARFYSGMLNAAMLMSIGMMLTLHTANLTNISINLVLGNMEAIWRPAAIVLAYLVGTFLTSAYFGVATNKLIKKYWQGYALVAVILVCLSFVPIESMLFMTIFSGAMGIIWSMPLTNHGYTGTIAIMTGLMTEMMANLGQALFYKTPGCNEQFFYLFKNFIAYLLGTVCQTLLYVWLGSVCVWPLALMAVILAFWAYTFGVEEV